jgi:hypothetical protein
VIITSTPGSFCFSKCRRFKRDELESYYFENNQNRTIAIFLKPTTTLDPSQITYSLEAGVSEKYPIILDTSDGSVYVRGDLDRERESEFTFQVIAR